MKRSNWPLHIIRKDGTKEYYETHKDYVNAGHTDSMQSIAYRAKMTLLNGHFRDEMWLLENYEGNSRPLNTNRNTFTCEYCKIEKPVRVYCPRDEKKIVNYVTIEGLYNLEYTKKINAKQCLDCFKEYNREFWGDLKSEDLLKKPE